MPFKPGRQMTREEMRAAAAEIAAGRPPMGSIGNYQTSGMGTITREALPQFYQDQLQQTNIDDSGSGIWNFDGGAINTRDGRRVTQLGDTGGVWDNREVKDWNQVGYDPELGLETEWGNIDQKPDAGVRNLRTAILATMAAGAGSGLYGMYAGEGAGAMAGAPSDSYWSMLADGGNVASDAIPAAVSGSGSPWSMLAPGMENSALADSWLINQGPLGAQVAGTGITNALSPSSLGSAVARNPMRALQGASLLANMFSNGGGGDSGSGGDAGPTTLGSMGWKPPATPEHKTSPALLEQMRRARMPISELRRMYG